MLETVQYDRSLTDDRLVVARYALLLIIAAMARLTDEKVDLVDATILFLADMIRIDFVVEVAPAEGDRMLIVDRDLPARHGNTGMSYARR
jgi:hypothetical protein